MAKKKPRVYDVFIVQLDTGYQNVPFTVIVDWLQQGRLLAEDKIRPPGTATWYVIGKVPKLATFLPKPAAIPLDDQAEALEPVDLGLNWPSLADSDEQDVDMVPLIDISLVLLIFFMMAASVSTGYTPTHKMPEAETQLAAASKDMYWVGVSAIGPKGEKKKSVNWYSVGLHKTTFALNANDQRVTKKFSIVASVLQKKLKDKKGLIKMNIRADESLPIEEIHKTITALQELQAEMPGVRFEIVGGVRAPQ